MPSECANPSCSRHRTFSEGTIFRLDMEIGDIAGRHSTKTEYIWLCSRCSAVMRPAVEVTHGAVRLWLRRSDERSRELRRLSVA